jgi:16S rRNA (guanine966-N2)-methyltransferase
MRIVGGRFRGRSLATPSSDAIRPTSDRLRETIFNILAHAYDGVVEGARVVDLFAGTGAMGFEAISRGASFALLVDDSAAARSLIRENIDRLGLGGATRLFRRDATRLGPAGQNGTFSLLFCDPPYGRDLAPAALASAAEGGWLGLGALAVVEERAGAFVLPPRFEELDRRRVGDTDVTFARFIG